MLHSVLITVNWLTERKVSLKEKLYALGDPDLVSDCHKLPVEALTPLELLHTHTFLVNTAAGGAGS